MLLMGKLGTQGKGKLKGKKADLKKGENKEKGKLK